MSDFSLTLVLQIKISKIINDIAKVQQKSEKISAFGGLFFVLDKFDRILSSVIDSHLGLRSKLIGVQHDGENCFIRDDNQSFANICIELLNNQQLRTTMREQGRKMVIEHYSWDEKLKGYELISAR